MNNSKEHTRLNEAKIIEAAKTDHKYFAPLYERYFHQIFLFVLKRVGDESLCGDLTSQVFFKALTKIKSYKNMGYPFSAWLYRIAINEVNMHFRKNNKHQVVEVKDSDVKVMMKEIDEVEDADAKLKRVLQHLGSMSETDQKLIELRFFDKCSFKEIGLILDISEGNAKIKTYRALDKLKKLIGGERV